MCGDPLLLLQGIVVCSNWSLFNLSSNADTAYQWTSLRTPCLATCSVATSASFLSGLAELPARARKLAQWCGLSLLDCLCTTRSRRNRTQDILTVLGSA